MDSRLFDAGISEVDERELELWLVEFDQNWHENRLGELFQRLPPAASAVRVRALLEIVKVDLEHRWQCGRRMTIESYLQAYPELGTAETVSAELVQTEYEVRQQFKDHPNITEYENRFPNQANELRALMLQRRELVAEYEMVQPCRETVSFRSMPTPSVAIATSDLPKLPPEFGRYRIQRRLGRGGMGEVYLAHDTQLDRDVALKIPQFQSDGDPEVLKRFSREARAAAMLLHPNICPIHDVGEIGGIHYLTMAYVEGSSLAELARQDKPIPGRQVANLIHKLALTLQEAHARGVVHRDLKPSNIMIDQRGEPIIMDFGLAWMTNGSRPGEERLTQSGLALGTPAYMSPEQIRGELEKLGAGCDVYSLGVIMYELLTGQLPFQGPMRSMLVNILTQEPTPPSSIRQDVDVELERICLKAIAKTADTRFASMTELADALSEYLSTDRHLAQRRRVPRRAWVGLASVVAAILLGTILLIATDYGTIKIVLSDPKAQVQLKVNGNDVEIDRQLRLRAREYGLEVTGKDFVTITKVFRVRRGRNDSLSIELIPKQSNGATTETKPAPSMLTYLVPPRTPEEIVVRRQQYLDTYLKPFLSESEAAEVPSTTHEKAFPPHLKTQFELSTDGMTTKLFRDWECTRQLDAERETAAKLDYFKAYFDAESRLRQVECYGKDGSLREGPFGCAMARYWYDAKGNRVQEAYFGINSQPTENAELVVALHCAFDAQGGKMETRFYDQRGQPMEDRIGVHRRVYQDRQVRLEYRLDGSRREKWLPALNLGKRINAQSAWHPAFTPDGKELYFAVGWTGDRAAGPEQIFRVTWQPDRWSDPEPVTADGQPLLGLRPCISGDGQRMVFVAWKSDPYRSHREYPDLANYGKADLYFVEKRGNIWSAVRNAGPKINRFDEEGGATFIPGTQSLCFSRVGPNGEKDLWIADREGELWGEPRLVEVKPAYCPVMSSDGKRLYFSSTRKGSFGGDDLWMCEKQGDSWSRAMNLGPEINHVWHDSRCTFALDGQVIYFDRCCPWNLMVSGRANSEAAIRHMADIYALGEWELDSSALDGRLTKAEKPRTVGERIQSDSPELLHWIDAEIRAGLPFDPADPRNERIRQKLLDYSQRLRGTSESRSVADLMAKVSWPVDALSRGRISEYERTIAGNGESSLAPTNLVAVLGDSRLKHWNAAHSVAFSPDDRLLVTASYDQSVRIWDVATGQQKRIMLGHSTHIYTAAFTPDATIIASAGIDKEITLWNTATGKRLRRLFHGANVIRQVSFSPDGKLLAAGGYDGILRLWNVNDWSEAYLPNKIHTGEVNALSFSRDGKLLATAGGSDKTARILELDSGKARQPLVGHKDSVMSVAFSPDNETLATASFDGTVKLWKVASSEPDNSPRTLTLPGKVWSVAFSPDGKTLVTSCDDNLIRLHKIANLETPVVLGRHTNKTLGLAFSHDGRTLASAALDGTVKLWDVTEGNEKKIASATSHHAGASAVCITPDGRCCVSSGYDGNVIIWDLSTGEPRYQPIRPFRDGVRIRDMAICPHGSQIAVAAQLTSESIKFWDIRTGKHIRTFSDYWCNSVAFSPDERFIATGNESKIRDQNRKSFAIWDFAKGRVVSPAATPKSDVHCVTFSPDGRLAAGASDEGVTVWDVAAGSIKYGPLAPKSSAYCVAFSPDGSVLASGGKDNLVSLWDAATGKHKTDLRGHTDAIKAVTFSPDSRMLATCAEDGMIRLWNVDLGSVFEGGTLYLGPPEGAIHDLAFTPEGRHLVSANGNGTLFVLRLREFGQ